MGKEYVVSRSSICAGKLLNMRSVHYDNLTLSSKGDQFDQEMIRMELSTGIACRGMLFTVTEDNVARDLIYTTPTNYSIETIQPKISTDSSLIITDYVELEELLKHLNYGEYLTQKELYEIYKKLILTKRWLKMNQKLFDLDTILYDSFATEAPVTVSEDIYYHLSSIESVGRGKPCSIEPGYSKIKKRKIAA